MVALKLLLLGSVVGSSWVGPSPNKKINYKGGMRLPRGGLGGRGGWASGWVDGSDGVCMGGGGGGFWGGGVCWGRRGGAGEDARRQSRTH